MAAALGMLALTRKKVPVAPPLDH
ncbi:MAG: hypothetical protein M3Y65_18265 [Pseudomonadota bacterium]|nr:hypothetical protein [Pseudomonadota bacterium]